LIVGAEHDQPLDEAGSVIFKGSFGPSNQRMKYMKIVLSFICFFSLCGLGYAQNQHTVGKFSEKLYEQSEKADKIEENVLQMLQGPITDHEYRVGMNVYDQAVKFEASVSQLLTLSYIYSAMRDKRDKLIAEKYFYLNCKSTAKYGNTSIERINKALPSIQSIALINEINKMRDAISEMLKTLEVCKE